MSPVVIDAVILVIALLFILGAAELFTNGVEWLGQHLGLSEGVVGSVLAAVGTALPETLIPIVAVIGIGEAHNHDVGIGAIAGAPFMLTTLTFCLCGTAVFFFARAGRRPPELKINNVLIGRDLSFFIGCYGAAILTTLIHVQPLRWAVAIGLLVAYGVYLKLVFQHEGETGEAPEHLHVDWLLKSGRALWAVVAQVVLGLVGILIGSILFVKYTENMSTAMGVHPSILALIIAPIATELPEKVNSVLWARNGKDTLALANISGALVFQSCFPVAFGVAFTDWKLGPAITVSACAAVIVASIFLMLVKQNKLKSYHLMLGGLAYVGTMAFIVLDHLTPD